MDDLHRNQTPDVAQCDRRVSDDEEDGGDPPCWAHLFEDELGFTAADAPITSDVSDQSASAVGASPVLDLLATVQAFHGRGAATSLRSDDLNLNVMVFRQGEGVAEHINETLDVVWIAIDGEAVVTLNSATHSLKQGQLLLIPKGTWRSITAQSARFAYLTCHQHRFGLVPTLRRLDSE